MTEPYNPLGPFTIESRNKDYRRNLERKDASMIPDTTWHELEQLSVDPVQFPPHIVGSYALRIQRWPADIDINEYYFGCCSAKDVAKQFAPKFKSIVAKIQKKREHYYSEVKAGLDDRYEVDLGTLQNGIYTPGQELVDQTVHLFESKLLPEKEFDAIGLILTIGKERQLRANEYEAIQKIYKDHYVLKWSVAEIKKGFKMLPGKKKKMLADACGDMALLKIDEITFVDGNLNEISNIFKLGYYQKDHEANLIEDSEFQRLDIPGKPTAIMINNVEPDRLEEIEKLYFSDMYYNPFKCLKRIFSFLKQKDQQTQAQQQKFLKDIIRFISSDISRLYQVKSQLETAKLVIDNNSKRIAKAAFNRQLNNIINTIATSIQISKPDADVIISQVKLIQKTANKEAQARQIDIVDSILNVYINYHTIRWMGKYGYNPPPAYVLPPIAKYDRRIIRTPRTKPENFMDILYDIKRDRLHKLPSERHISSKNLPTPQLKKKAHQEINKIMSELKTEGINITRTNKGLHEVIDDWDFDPALTDAQKVAELTSVLANMLMENTPELSGMFTEPTSENPSEIPTSQLYESPYNIPPPTDMPPYPPGESPYDIPPPTDLPPYPPGESPYDIPPPTDMPPFPPSEEMEMDVEVLNDLYKTYEEAQDGLLARAVEQVNGLFNVEGITWASLGDLVEIAKLLIQLNFNINDAFKLELLHLGIAYKDLKQLPIDNIDLFAHHLIKFVNVVGRKMINKPDISQKALTTYAMNTKEFNSIAKLVFPELYKFRPEPEEVGETKINEEVLNWLNPQRVLSELEEPGDIGLGDLFKDQQEYSRLVTLFGTLKGSMYPNGSYINAQGVKVSTFNPEKKAINDRLRELYAKWGSPVEDLLSVQQLSEGYDTSPEGSGFSKRKRGGCDFLSGNVCAMKQGDGCCGMGYMGRMRQDRSF